MKNLVGISWRRHLEVPKAFVKLAQLLWYLSYRFRARGPKPGSFPWRDQYEGRCHGRDCDPVQCLKPLGDVGDPCPESAEVHPPLFCGILSVPVIVEYCLVGELSVGGCWLPGRTSADAAKRRHAQKRGGSALVVGRSTMAARQRVTVSPAAASSSPDDRRRRRPPADRRRRSSSRRSGSRVS